MTHEQELLHNFLKQIPEIPAEQLSDIADCIPVQQFAKGHILQREGSVPRACYFVLEGLVREYRITDGKEFTTEFYDEQHGAISSRHFVEQSPSDFFVECLEDSVLLMGTRDQSLANFERFPVLQPVTAKMVQSDLNDRRIQFADFITATPQQRYENLLSNRPGLIQRAPLQQIASYLGITPETLSRIRNRMSKAAR